MLVGDPWEAGRLAADPWLWVEDLSEAAVLVADLSAEDSSVEAGLAAGLSVEAELEVAAQCSWAAACW